jgi:hypothetical protein
MVANKDVKVQILETLFHIKRGVPFAPYDPFKVLFQEHHDYVLIKSGRQVSKTTSGLILDLIRVLMRPSFYLLIILPLERQTLRVNNEFLKPIISLSPLFNIIIPEHSSTRIHFPNSSVIEFSYTSTSKSTEDVTRIRGTPADMLHFDEVQDIPYKVLPVIKECLSASRYQYELITGTPKTTNNTLQYLWEQTTCSEWCIPCEACGYKNICSADADLLQIIGPYRDDISDQNPATICAKCGSVIFPQKGYWLPRFTDRPRLGLHIPQVIIPVHYANPANWKKLLNKKDLKDGYTLSLFYQEVLGEAYDVAARLITLSDILAVSDLGDRNKSFDELKRIWMPRYRFTTLGIDWGGGGESGNYTTIALAGLNADGVIEVPWAYESPTPHDHIGEAKLILKIFSELQPNLIAHDFSGAGALRETILIQSGIPLHRIYPFRYVGNQSVAVRLVEGLPNHPRPFFQIEPNKSMLYVVGSIKRRMIRFFNDLESSSSLLKHFLSLIDETPGKGLIDHYRIGPEPGTRDEFAQATMLACLAIWQNSSFPNFQI